MLFWKTSTLSQPRPRKSGLVSPKERCVEHALEREEDADGQHGEGPIEGVTEGLEILGLGVPVAVRLLAFFLADRNHIRPEESVIASAV